jgi:hypothetical protein
MNFITKIIEGVSWFIGVVIVGGSILAVGAAIIKQLAGW